MTWYLVRESSRISKLLDQLPDVHLDLPVSYKDQELGVISMHFRLNEELELNQESRDLIGWTLLEMEDIMRSQLRSNLLHVLKMREEMQNHPYMPFYRLMLFYTWGHHQIVSSLSTFLSDDEIIELIEKRGPSSLGLSIVQDKLYMWTSSRRFLKQKMKKLGEALFEYWKYFKDTASPSPGRPQDPIFQTFGTDWVQEMYSDLREVIKVVKKQDSTKFTSLVEETYIAHLKMKLIEYKKKHRTEKEIMGLQNIIDYFEGLRDSGVPNFIVECFNKDKRLRHLGPSDFLPSEMAIRIIASLCEVSNQTIKDIIHRKKN